MQYLRRSQIFATAFKKQLFVFELELSCPRHHTQASGDWLLHVLALISKQGIIIKFGDYSSPLIHDLHDCGTGTKSFSCRQPPV